MDYFMIDLIEEGKITASFKENEKVAVVNNQQVPLGQFVKSGNWEALAKFGLFKREKKDAALNFDQHITKYNKKVIDGKPVDVPVVKKYTAAELEQVLKMARKQAVGGVREYAEEVREDILPNTTDKQRDFWTPKGIIARVYQQQKAFDAAGIDIEWITGDDLAVIDTEIQSSSSGKTRDQVAAEWNAKATAFGKAGALISGMTERAEKAVNDATLIALEPTLAKIKKQGEDAKSALLPQ